MFFIMSNNINVLNKKDLNSYELDFYFNRIWDDVFIDDFSFEDVDVLEY